ncbi:hypothetical protein KA013_01510 [Patescibacteria group bacterium]|nr:hypothetical protein [Patescibacteria group bacterium]
MRKTYKNSDLTPTPNVPTFDDFYYNKIKTTEEATLNALNNIQKSDAPYILHEVSLFMVPGELRKFVNENLNSNPKQIETSLKSAIEADINKIHAEKGDKTIEQVISDRILQLSKEDQKKIVEYAKMKEITLA